MAGPSRRQCIVAGAAASLALPGCTRRDSGTLRFWAMGREGEVVSELLQDFRSERPDIHVKVEQLPWSAAHEKLLTAFAGDATPDIAQLGNTWLPEFVALGALEPLDAHIAGATGVDSRDYFEGIWATNVIEGRVFGLPWYIDTRLLFYRRDLLHQAGFERPASSWATWERQLQAIKRLVGPDKFSVLLPLNEFEPLVALALQTGEPLLREGGRYGNFRGAGFQRTLAFYLSLYQQQLAPPATSNQIANVWNEFARGYFSFYITGPWNIGEFGRRLPPALQGAWATAPLPGPDGPGASIAGGSSLALFAHSKHKSAAWALVSYLSRPQVQQRFRRLTGNLPPRRSAWTDPELQADPHSQAFREQLERVRPVPQVPEWERIATELRVLIEQVVHGDVEAANMPAEMDRRADRMLEKRRWMLARKVS
ncbi:MAG TPA: sugar ABC transporter substrate-binding protein [Rubrivivax sp.]|nr:sugar ABC transporter substrate-binding protein [Rubrivivax sp.]